MEPSGRLLGLSLDALGTKMTPKSDAIIEFLQFCFHFGRFSGAIVNFLRFGRVWGGFWKDFGKFFKRFWETHRLCFGTAHRLRFWDSRAAKTNKLQWVPRLGPAECAKRLNPPHPLRMSRRMRRSSAPSCSPRD